MRQKRTTQVSIYELFADHDLGRELQGMSEWLDAHPKVLTPVMNDLCRRGLKSTGRRGLSGESVLRCAILKQHRQLSYEELAFRAARFVGRIGSALRDPQAAPAIEL